jgi:Fe-Mn family superoxide dismutase
MKYPFSLPKLDYSYEALEPHIDRSTMEIHYAKHHQAYVNKLNEVVEKYPDLQKMELNELMENIKSLVVEESDRTTLINNGGGHLNHSLFWQIMGPTKEIDESLIGRIKSEFGSVEEFKTKLTNQALGRFGSGWAWLVEDSEGKLGLYSTGNQDSPYLNKHKPLIGIDVWEHAYYLKYQNRRAEYLENWWKALKTL